MKTRISISGGVSKSNTYRWVRRQHHLPANFIARWNSSLVIRSPVRERHQSQSSIRSFFLVKPSQPSIDPGSASTSNADNNKVDVKGSKHVPDTFYPAECMQHNQEVPMIGVNSPEPQKESAAICTQSSLQENSKLITSVTSDQIASVKLTGVSDNNNLET